MNQPNPYQSPAGTSYDQAMSSLPPLPEDRQSEIAVRAELVRQTWLTRRIRLTGDINAELFYDAAGSGERLYLDRFLVVKTSPWQLRSNVTPHIDFFLEANGYAVPASIDVTAPLLRLLKLTNFTLSVAGRTVYKE